MTTTDARTIHHRLGIAHRALTHHHTHAHHPARRNSADRITAAVTDLEFITATGRITRALAHLADHQGGYPSGGQSGSRGIGTHSDRTGNLAERHADHHAARRAKAEADRTGTPLAAHHRRALTAPDQVAADLHELDTLTARIERTALHLLCSPDTNRLTRQLETDTARTRWLIAHWSREPDMRWCHHCWQTNRHREPAAVGKYRDLCRPCGDWRRVNKALPPADVIGYLQTRKPVPQLVLNRHRAKLPRPARRTTER